MNCPLYNDYECPMPEIYGACFFCSHALSQISLLEAESLYCEDEDE